MRQCAYEKCGKWFEEESERQKYCCKPHSNKQWCLENPGRVRVRKGRICEFAGCENEVEVTTSSKYCIEHRDRAVRIPAKVEKEYVPPAPKFTKGSGVYNLQTSEELDNRTKKRIDMIVAASQKPGYNKHHPERYFDHE